MSLGIFFLLTSAAYADRNDGHGFITARNCGAVLKYFSYLIQEEGLDPQRDILLMGAQKRLTTLVQEFHYPSNGPGERQIVRDKIETALKERLNQSEKLIQRRLNNFDSARAYSDSYEARTLTFLLQARERDSVLPRAHALFILSLQYEGERLNSFLEELQPGENYWLIREDHPQLQRLKDQIAALKNLETRTQKGLSVSEADVGLEREYINQQLTH